ncbi:CJH_07325 family protein [Sulfurimonas sp.]|uniref:CJH_07325 family protein n=1 Tax=Sulfurimonas sp. TaxID=2022749 RepID=UPI003569BA3C
MGVVAMQTSVPKQTLRSSLKNRGYINLPFFNTGSVSGSQYSNKDDVEKDDLDKAIDSMDSTLSDLFDKYSKYFIK